MDGWMDGLILESDSSNDRMRGDNNRRPNEDSLVIDQFDTTERLEYHFDSNIPMHLSLPLSLPLSLSLVCLTLVYLVCDCMCERRKLVVRFLSFLFIRFDSTRKRWIWFDPTNPIPTNSTVGHNRGMR